MFPTIETTEVTITSLQVFKNHKPLNSQRCENKDCSEFGNFVITLIMEYKIYEQYHDI